jgi:hypothetical protein
VRNLPDGVLEGRLWQVWCEPDLPAGRGRCLPAVRWTPKRLTNDASIGTASRPYLPRVCGAPWFPRQRRGEPGRDVVRDCYQSERGRDLLGVIGAKRIGEVGIGEMVKAREGIRNPIVNPPHVLGVDVEIRADAGKSQLRYDFVQCWGSGRIGVAPAQPSCGR